MFAECLGEKTAAQCNSLFNNRKRCILQSASSNKGSTRRRRIVSDTRARRASTFSVGNMVMFRRTVSKYPPCDLDHLRYDRIIFSALKKTT